MELFDYDICGSMNFGNFVSLNSHKQLVHGSHMGPFCHITFVSIIVMQLKMYLHS